MNIRINNWPMELMSYIFTCVRTFLIEMGQFNVHDILLAFLGGLQKLEQTPAPAEGSGNSGQNLVL